MINSNQNLENNSPDIEETPNRRTPRKPVIAAAIGNAMEWYDFGVYAYFATVISTVFFPGSEYGLLLTFATFGVGFAMRPLGGLIFGHFGDKHGRRAALTLTITLMGIATLTIGFIPSEAQIGVWAPILLVTMRLLQGFSVGGEYAGSTAFLVEYANPQRRGLVGSFQSFSVFIGSLAGSLAGLITTSVLTEAAVNSWGWRVPFFIGGALAVVALYMRLKIEDTPAFKELDNSNEVQSAPIIEVFRTHWLQMIKLFFIVIYFTVSYYIVLTYAPTFLSEEAGIPLSVSLMATSLAIIFGACVVLFAGHLSDKIGRKPLLILAAILSAILAYPAFSIMHTGTTVGAIGGILMIMLPTAILYGVAPTMFAEAMPTRVRYIGISLPYNLATATFGGFAAFIATLLIQTTSNPLSPSFYVIGAAVIAALVLLTVRETAKKNLA